MDATELLVWGALIHLVVDWLGQSEWMAEQKTDLTRPAAYVHAGMHGAAQLLIFPPLACLALALVHVVIDTRRPLEWWARIVRQPTTGAMAISVHIWRDQTLHLATIAVAAIIVG